MWWAEYPGSTWTLCPLCFKYINYIICIFSLNAYDDIHTKEHDEFTHYMNITWPLWPPFSPFPNTLAWYWPSQQHPKQTKQCTGHLLVTHLHNMSLFMCWPVMTSIVLLELCQIVYYDNLIHGMGQCQIQMSL